MPRKLSPRTIAIRRALRNGDSVKDIALSLGVTPGYVYSIRARMPERRMPVGIASLPVAPSPPPPPPPKPSLWDRLLSSFRD